MGKKLSDLHLGKSGPPPRDDLKASRHQGSELLDTVTTMLESGDFDFAWGFLKDLSLTLEHSGVATRAQMDAVHNIQAGQARQAEQREGWARHERRTGRRYEGWEPSR